MIQAGRNRKRPHFKRATDTRLSDGSITRAWSTFRRWWVSIKNESGRELMMADRPVDRTRVVISMRAMEELREDDRVEDGPFRYEIDSISDREERHAEMQILCTRRRLRCLTAGGKYVTAGFQCISLNEENA